jgi:hypothetical protein
LTSFTFALQFHNSPVFNDTKVIVSGRGDINIAIPNPLSSIKNVSLILYRYAGGFGLFGKINSVLIFNDYHINKKVGGITPPYNLLISVVRHHFQASAAPYIYRLLSGETYSVNVIIGVSRFCHF